MTTFHPIDPQTLNEWLKKGEAVLVDVREADEFAAEHIPYAISVPLSKITTAMPDLLNDKRKIVFQCKLGKRGEQACSFALAGELKAHDILNLEGGIIAWKGAGLPTI